MNKALILLLVIFVQSQSDGILLPNSNHHQFQDPQLEGWDGEEFPYAEDVNEEYKKRSLTNDALTRRSALDKNFMRFGRGGSSEDSSGDSRTLFYDRMARGAKDNFIRFGRGGDKSGFIRFGRARPEDFFRAGKSVRENFIRFGKPDRNFMRFGRERSEETFPREEKASRAQENFMRFGKNGKNGTNFVRFGKAEESEGEERKRRKREAEEDRGSRSTPFFPPDVSRAIPGVLGDSWQTFDQIDTSRLTPFFPVFLASSRNAHPKRNNGGSNFIRFG